MPSWRLHAKWGDLVIGFHSKEIDEVIDRRESHDAGRYEIDVLKTQLATVSSRFGVKGELYYVLHHILDRFEDRLESEVTKLIEDVVYGDYDIRDRLGDWLFSLPHILKGLLSGEGLGAIMTYERSRKLAQELINSIIERKLVYTLAHDIIVENSFKEKILRNIEMSLTWRARSHDDFNRKLSKARESINELAQLLLDPNFIERSISESRVRKLYEEVKNLMDKINERLDS